MALIVAVGFWIYAPALHGDWLWDDDYLIEHNSVVNDPYGIWDIWLSPGTLIDYFPLTVSLEWLEWQLWPNDPFVFHLTSLLCHVGSALLVWRLLAKLGLRLAWLGGLIFVLHPVQVESVAWMAELKNTFSMLPFLLAMGAWIDFDRRGKWEDYFLALGLFVVAMLAKTTMVMFPVVILMHAWWRRGRIGWGDLKTSAAFFGVSLAIGLVMLNVLHFGVGGQPVPLGGFFSRLACAGLSVSFYFSKCILPLELLPMYPQWKVDPPSLEQFLPVPILAGALYWLWTKRGEWGRHVLFGLGFFLVNLAPFVGFRANTFMRFTWVMDHYLYIPIIGLIGLAVAAMGQIDERLTAPRRPFAFGVLAIVLAVLAVGSHRYAEKFVSLESLWSYTVRHSPGAWLAHNDLGFALVNLGREPEAITQFEEAVAINPNFAEAHCNLGVLYQRAGRFAEAKAQYEWALRVDPDCKNARPNMEALDAAEKAVQGKR